MSFNNKVKKKILFVSGTMASGVLTYLVNLTNEIVDDFDVYIAYGIRKDTPSNFKQLFNNKVHFILVKDLEREISLTKDIKAFMEIKKISRQINPDIIHLHSSKAGVLGRLAFSGRDTPVFYTPHGYSFLMKNASEKKKHIYRLIEKLSARKNTITISCSYGENEETQKLTRNAEYINNGIDTRKIDKYITNSPDMNTVFTLGRISEQKNPELFNNIAKKFPNTKFVWIGGGKQKNKLTSPNIEVTGWLSNDEALKKAANYGIFILPSQWEGLPMALLEAMYMKKVCIVSNIIGNNNVIKDGYNGYLCNNLDDYLKAVDSSLNGKVPQSFTLNAHKDVEKKYTAQIMGEKYKSLYFKSLNSRNKLDDE